MPHRFALTLSCEDRPGIVAAVSAELAAMGANIVESNQFWDRQTNRFFMRVAFDAPDGKSRDDIDRLLSPAADRFSMKTTLRDMQRKPRIVIMVSRFDHAMHHLLYQIRVGQLNAEVVAIVSNHADAGRDAAHEGLTFHHWPVTKVTKEEQEARLLALVRDTGADLVILARYMQVLSDKLSKSLFGKIINIHHSFLPSFKGARPYFQAHDRGVKLIGATAHYVTADLDEGPIIEQDVERVDHTSTPETLTAIGADVERRALARAVRWHAEHRVLLDGHRTIVFK